MKFCAICDNMYYVTISEKDGNQLLYYCRNCGHKDDTITSESVCVLNTQLKKGEQKFSHIINEYTKFDPTLPRVHNMKCPNASCKSNAVSGGGGGATTYPEVIYVRYDDDNMKYLYLCSECDVAWKTDDTH